MTIIYAGDLHGRHKAYHLIDTAAKNLNASAIVQVGDSGVFWPGCDRIERYFADRDPVFTCPWYIVDGNHEWHTKLDEIWNAQGQPDAVELFPNVMHMRRGSHLEIDGIMHVFCGGATSIDKYNRKDGVSWWAREVPSKEEFDKFYDAIQEHKPDVIVTHEVGDQVPLYKSGRYNDPVMQTFTQIVNMTTHKPKRWYFGHHHMLGEWPNAAGSGIDFYGCGLHGDFKAWTNK